VRAWLDALTPKQLLFLLAIKEELEARGADVLLTTRSYDELDPIERRLGVKTTKVGSHGGEGLDGKLEASLRRAVDLHGVISDFRPDLAITTASPEAARISYGLKIPLVVLNDSPHSVAVAKLVVPLASALYSPWLIRKSDWMSAGIIPARYGRYRSIDPVAWLNRRHLWPPKEPWEDSRGAIVIRAGESMAYYYGGSEEDAVALARYLAGNYKVVLLTRYSGREVDGVRVVGPGFFGPNLLEGAMAFVGYGGTMSQEALLMGVPAISAYPGGYRIERELVRRGLILKAEGVEEIGELVGKSIENRAHIEARAMAFRKALTDPAKFAAEEGFALLEH
jgi:predicted glycosyltransferase